jgi:hypothetical protein
VTDELIYFYTYVLCTLVAFFALGFVSQSSRDNGLLRRKKKIPGDFCHAQFWSKSYFSLDVVLSPLFTRFLMHMNTMRFIHVGGTHKISMKTLLQHLLFLLYPLPLTYQILNKISLCVLACHFGNRTPHNDKWRLMWVCRAEISKEID